MNYLQLAQKVHLILRIGEETPGTQPSAVAVQQGILAEMVSWVREAHRDICLDSSEWTFMRGGGTFSLAMGVRSISKAAMISAQPTYGKLQPFVTNDSAYVGQVPTGVDGAAEQVVVYVPYQQWQGNYDAVPIPTGAPTYFTILPDQSLEFDAYADRDYTIRSNFRKQVVPLSVDASEPMFDSDYHDAIVWWAIVHYYCPSRDGTENLLKKATIELARYMSKLRNEQLPEFVIA